MGQAVCSLFAARIGSDSDLSLLQAQSHMHRHACTPAGSSWVTLPVQVKVVLVTRQVAPAGQPASQPVSRTSQVLRRNQAGPAIVSTVAGACCQHLSSCVCTRSPTRRQPQLPSLWRMLWGIGKGPTAGSAGACPPV